MANLFWKVESDTKSLVSTPFKTEEEFEKLIFNTPEILEDIYLLKRQIRGGNKSGIPDIIGIDSDGKVCIVEMKNVRVDASIISQVLQYAFWAETNPDSIKSLWLENQNKPDNISISWDPFQVKIIVIAPVILSSTLDIVERINYEVDLIEVNRWIEGKNHFLLLKKLQQENGSKRNSPVKGLIEYNYSFYKKEYNTKSAVHFEKYTKELEEIVKKNDWNLDLKFNKHYISFKAGYRGVFGIRWIGSKTFAFFIKLSESELLKHKQKFTKYESEWKQASYYIEPGVTKTKDFEEIFRRAYMKFTGE